MELGGRILQIVGYQNSGKTELVCSLLAAGSSQNVKMASIKHHGHGGEPDLHQMKDSERHLKSGAFLAAVEGEGLMQLAMKKHEIRLDEIVALYKSLGADVILIEGYKREKYPKLVLIRNEEDLVLLEELQNIAAIAAPFYSEDFTSLDCPYFHIKDHQKICSWFQQNWLFTC
nr:molybdopterin-guanine dinucleotide biosynthesis protein B [Metabacillus kandeliae]